MVRIPFYIFMIGLLYLCWLSGHLAPSFILGMTLSLALSCLILGASSSSKLNTCICVAIGGTVKREYK